MARDFPNNWDLYKQSDDDCFIEHTYDEIMEWKVHGWELPSSVCCIIRAHNKETHKVKEYVYQQPAAADKRLQLLLTDGCEYEVTVVDHEQVHFFTKREE